MFSQTMEKKYNEIAARGKAEGKAEGIAEGIIEFLTVRLGPIDADLEQSIHAISDLARLKELARIAATCESLDEFQAALNK